MELLTFVDKSDTLDLSSAHTGHVVSVNIFTQIVLKLYIVYSINKIACKSKHLLVFEFMIKL